ncbi:interleukin-17 receptor C-like, partial [Clarias magur]
MSSPWSSLFLALAGACLCAADLRTYDSQDIITCSPGLTCTVVYENLVDPPSDFSAVEVLSFTLEPVLCLAAARTYKACLLIRIQLQILPSDVSGETSDDSEDEAEAAVTLCYASVPNLPSCMRIQLTVKSDSEDTREEPQAMEVVVRDGVFLGSSVNVTVNTMSQDVVYPQQNSVCRRFPDIEECKIPKFVAHFDLPRGVVELRGEPEELLQMCMRRKGMGSCWPSERTIPLHAVTHCMCFQAWKKNAEDKQSSRSTNCPFENHTEIRRNAVKNVSFSVRHSETNEGHPALSWNVSAPCRLEAEVWPCQRAVYLGGGCGEVPGFRRNVSTGWEENITMVWISDTFQNVRTTNGLAPCVMFKIDGEIFGPVCECDAHRGRWICGVFATLLVSILLAVGVFVFRSRLKGWLSKSIPVHQSS